MKSGWKETPLLRKIAMVCSIIVASAVIVLALLQIFDVWQDAAKWYVPCMGINLLLQAYAQWQPNRRIAIFDLCAAGVIFLCAVIILLVPGK